MASFTDVTELKRLERVKGEMMNIVSHELKLPLTSIIGFAEMLQEKLIGEDKQYITEIYQQSTRLGQMIEDFLDISRMESGRYKINKYAFDIIASIHDAITCTHPLAERKHIKIHSKLPLKASAILGDEVLVTQMVINLLENAVKFSPENSRVDVTLVENEQEITIKIADQGPGISDEDKDNIFNKFIRGKAARDVEGFGLGLNFVKQVAENHNGTVTVIDNTEKGAIFIITLPKIF
jgi:signal transduction histidine kinase